MIVLYIGTILTNLFFGLKKRSNQIWTMISLGLAYIFMAGAGPFYPFRADYHRYIVHYEEVVNRGIFSSAQFGYQLLMRIGNFLGLPFDLFRLLVMAACFFLIYRFVIQRYNVNANYVIALYMSYGLIMDSEQFRNWIALTILLSGLHFLETGKLKDKGKFLMMMGIATSFHISFVFYVPLIFVDGKRRNYIVSLFFIISTLTAAIFVLNGNQIPFQQQIVNAIGNRRVDNYLSSQTNLGWVIPMILHLSSIFLSFWAREIIHVKHYGFDYNFEIDDSEYEKKYQIQKELRISNLIFWINIAMSVLFPIYIINLQFYRLMRSLLLITYVICAKASTYIRRRITNITFNAMVFCSVLIWLGFDLVLRIHPERLLIPFFFENIF